MRARSQLCGDRGTGTAFVAIYIYKNPICKLSCREFIQETGNSIARYEVH